MIRTPWVRRARYEQVMGLVLAQRDTIREQRTLIASLALQRDVATADAPAAPAAPAPKPEPSLVAQAIREEAGDDHRLARYLWRYVGTMRRDGATEAECAAAVHDWETTEPLGAAEG